MVEEKINDLIYEVRGKKIILIRDLAHICNITTKSLNQTIKRNILYFNEFDYFQMTNEEFNFWKSHIVTSNEDKIGLRTLPFVLTLDGINTLSTILKSRDAINKINEIKEYMINENKQYELITNNDFFPKNQGKIENLIYEINGIQVMLDSDLAILYSCENGTKTINQAVKRNQNRFPNDFYFQLTKEEFLNLKSQIGTSSLENYGGVRKLPYVFTEEGVAMLASVLRTENADIISVDIMRCFVKMRHFIRSNKVLFETVQNLSNRTEKKFIEYDKKFEILFSKFDNKEENEFIFFNGQFYDAYSKIFDILNLANFELIIVDLYADKKLLDIISSVKTNVILITMKDRNLKESQIDKYNKQYNNLKIVYNYDFHDRCAPRTII